MSSTSLTTEPKLIPFNLDIALKHPERVTALPYGLRAVRVIYIPEADSLSQVVIVWSNSTVDTYATDGRSDAVLSPVLFLTAETKIVPWESVDEVPEGVYFRCKNHLTCVRIAIGYDFEENKVLFGGHWETLPDLCGQWEFSPNRNGPWLPCGKEVVG